MSIRKRILPDTGNIAWQFDYRDRNGDRHWKQFPTRGAAVAYETKVRSELAANTHVPDTKSITVSDACELWLAAGDRDGLERSTMLQRRQHVGLHIKPLIGNMKLSELGTPQCQAFADDLIDTGRSRALARAVLTSFKGVIATAQVRGKIAFNPALPVELKKRRTEDADSTGAAVMIPTKDQLRAMLTKSGELWPLTKVAHARDGEQKLVAVCWRPLIFTGMRASELRGLAWPHVDLARGVIHVKQRADRFNAMGPPKSKAGKRDIPLAPMVINTLKEWKLACPATSADLVFPSERGQVIWHTNLYEQCFLALLEACELMRPPEKEGDIPTPPFNFHALRHAAASLFIEQGWIPKKIQTIMGHSSIQVTYDVYGHLFQDPKDDAQAMAQIEARLLG